MVLQPERKLVAKPIEDEDTNKLLNSKTVFA
jgi:hypothetical protein